MRVEREQLIEALRLRYDHHSAHAMLAAAADRAGLPEATSYDVVQVQAWRAALARLGDRLGAVEARLDALVGVGPPPPLAPVTAAAVPAPAPAPPVTPPPAPVVVAPATPATPPAPVETTIALTGVEVDDGVQVLVCGGPAALGDWDATRALPMSRRDDAWVATIALAPGTELAFKFLQRRADGEVIWEGGENRTAHAAARIDAIWR